MLKFCRMAALISAIALFLICLPTLAEGELAFVDLPQEIRPGKLIMISFTATLPDNVDISLVDESGTATMLYKDFPAKAGKNNFAFGGMSDNTAFPPGVYKLQAVASDSSASADLTIGLESPVVINVIPSDIQIVPGVPWYISVETNMQGILTVLLDNQNIIYEGTVNAGVNEIPWDGTVTGMAPPPGDYSLVVQLKDSTGYLSNAHFITVTLTDATLGAESMPEDSISLSQDITNPPEEVMSLSEEPASSQEVTAKPDGTAAAPVEFSPYPSNGELNYWTLPMDITNEAAIWEVMMQPITVLDGNQKSSYKLRASPEDDAEAVGEITYFSQGVRVLETLDNGWSLIEAYSSSFHNSTVKVYGEMVQGYVKTGLLQTKKPSQKMGLIIDKLTQRMYVFKDGKLYTELLISTGLVEDPNKLYTETQAGDYILVSKVGLFMSDNLRCDMAIRFNSGNLIHEVPHTLRADGSRYYDKTEAKLGYKASHGCVRIQRKKSPEGVNMQWIWNNYEKNTRVLIWEDYKGRQIPIPDADTPIYYNPDGGSYYHRVANCLDVREKFLPLTPFNYGQLEESAFASLTRCAACAPPMRESELVAINAAYAE